MLENQNDYYDGWILRQCDENSGVPNTHTTYNFILTDLLLI